MQAVLALGVCCTVQATPCMILEPDSGPLAATVQQQARQDNRLAYTLSEEYDTMHTQHLPLSTAQPQARLTQSTTSPLYSHVPHVSASRHDDAWGACVHAKQTRTLQHGPSTGTSGVPPCSVRQGHAMRAASEGGLGHRTGQGSHTAVGTACTAARSTCRSGSAGGALQGAAVCGDATGSELTIIRKCGQGAFGAGKQTRCSYVHCHVHCVPQPFSACRFNNRRLSSLRGGDVHGLHGVMQKLSCTLHSHLQNMYRFCKAGATGVFRGVMRSSARAT